MRLCPSTIYFPPVAYGQNSDRGRSLVEDHPIVSNAQLDGRASLHGFGVSGISQSVGIDSFGNPTSERFSDLAQGLGGSGVEDDRFHLSNIAEISNIVKRLLGEVVRRNKCWRD